MWSNLWGVWCPSLFLSTDWVTDYVCVCMCVSTTVLLVSSYRDGAVLRKQAPQCCLAGRLWPPGVIVHYHMKPKCRARPCYSHLSSSVGLSTWTWGQGQTGEHAHLLWLDQANNLHRYSPQVFPATELKCSNTEPNFSWSLLLLGLDTRE